MARRLLEPDAQVVISDVPQDRPKDSRYPPGAWRRRNWETLAALVRDSSDLARSPGRRTRKVVPRPCEDSTSMLPPSAVTRDRKSTRLNSSHVRISYAVF